MKGFSSDDFGFLLWNNSNVIFFIQGDDLLLLSMLELRELILLVYLLGGFYYLELVVDRVGYALNLLLFYELLLV